jgi:hypothetical protein
MAKVNFSTGQRSTPVVSTLSMSQRPIVPLGMEAIGEEEWLVSYLGIYKPIR